MSDNEFDKMKENEGQQLEGYKNYKGKKNNNLGKKIGAGVCAIALLLGLKACVDKRNNKNIKDFDLSGIDKSVSDTLKSYIKVPDIKLPTIEKDTTAPILIVEYSNEELTSSDVDVTISADEEVLPVEGWTLSENKTVLTKTYTSNVDETIKVSDLAGNTSLANVKIENIDKTLSTPTVSYSTKELTNGNVVVTISSKEEMKPVNGWTLSKDKKSMTKTYAENKTEKVTISDLTGNTNLVDVKVNNIDKTFNMPKVSYSTKELTNGDILVTITSDEAMKKIDGWDYSSPDKKSMSKIFTENIETTLTVSDLAGNTQNVKITINNIDKAFETPTVSYSATELTNGNIMVQISSLEPMKEIEGWTKVSDYIYTKIYTENTNEKVTVRDLAGNTQEVNININNIDKEFAKVTVNYKNYGGNKIVTITSDEELRPIKGWTLSNDKKTLQKTYSDNKTETIIVKDLAGNEQEVEIKVNGISHSSSSSSSSSDNNGNNGGNNSGDNKDPNQPDVPDKPDKPKPDVPDTPDESQDRDNVGKDDNQNTGTGEYNGTDDNDVELYNSTKEELTQLYMMKETLETIKIGELEFEYPVRSLTM